jgi:hypothetical protein
MTLVPEVSLRFDPRFDLEENWKICTQAVQEAQERGILATPLTVFSDEGKIVGWLLHGWQPPPTSYSYIPPQ